MDPQLDADPPPGDLAGHLAHREAVRRHLAAHQGRPQPPGALDGHHRTVAGDRAAGEHHPGRARVQHPLHDDAHGQAVFADALAAPVGDRLVVVQAGPAGAHPVEHRVGAADRQVGVLQPGEAGLGAVLQRGAGPDRHRAVAERRVGRRDLGGDLRRQRLPPPPGRAGRPRRARSRPGRPRPATRAPRAPRRPGPPRPYAGQNAAAVITKPRGTGSPARASSPSAAALPPARAASAAPTSAVPQVNGGVTR